jgi:hypothetical protein
MNRKFCCMALALLMTTAWLVSPQPAQAQQNAYLQQRFAQEPSAAWMALDTLTFRPVGVVGTVGGIGMFMGTLPLTLATGTAGEASRTFIEQPARWTFH